MDTALMLVLPMSCPLHGEVKASTGLLRLDDDRARQAGVVGGPGGGGTPWWGRVGVVGLGVAVRGEESRPAHPPRFYLVVGEQISDFYDVVCLGLLVVTVGRRVENRLVHS